MSRQLQTEVGGRKLAIEFGKLAGQASAAVTVRYADTIVLVTVCSSQPREGTDFFPLTVDYEERLYAAGKIPGGFIKREGRPSQQATLAARLTDRAIRPLFPKGFRNEVQVVITVLSTDQENDPDILALLGASAALTLSDIPFEGPLGVVRIGYTDGELVLNPTFSQLATSQLDLVVAGTKQAVVMLEAGAKEVSESLVLEAIKSGHKANQELIELQEQLRQLYGKPKMQFTSFAPSHELEQAVADVVGERLAPILSQTDRWQRQEALEKLRWEVLEKLGGDYKSSDISEAFEQKAKAEFRTTILKRGSRLSNRKFDEIRPISCEVGVLPRTHGSGLFTRGDTQVLSITTLGSPGEEQLLDTISQEESKRFMHHYNFPPFSTGEVKRMGTPGRREIGHGALAERSLEPLIPPVDKFPYTVRVVSEVLSSSGSTSMASVCASSLSLMDAGVPIKSHVAGIAMGLISANGRYQVITDIEGLEDAWGDMDFKVAGTPQGITAVQMDIKLKGIGQDVIEKALLGAQQARQQVLSIMQQAITSSRAEMSPYAPRMYRMTIDPEKIGAVIGPGGRTIRAITAETKATIDVENDGTVVIGSANEEAAQKAMRIIGDLTREIEVGAVYTGKVTRIMSFGALVEIMPGKEGMVHISELADYRVPSVEDVVKVGDEVMVKVIETDRTGKIRLSRRAVFEETPRPDARGPRPTFPRRGPQEGGRPPTRRSDSPPREGFRPR
jgi:polyribonucleotide nucleotidyltransferase